MQEGGWQGGKSQPRGALQIIPASLSSETLGGGGIVLRLTAPSFIQRSNKSERGLKTEEERRRGGARWRRELCLLGVVPTSMREWKNKASKWEDNEELMIYSPTTDRLKAETQLLKP